MSSINFKSTSSSTKLEPQFSTLENQNISNQTLHIQSRTPHAPSFPISSPQPLLNRQASCCQSETCFGHHSFEANQIARKFIDQLTRPFESHNYSLDAFHHAFNRPFFRQKYIEQFGNFYEFGSDFLLDYARYICIVLKLTEFLNCNGTLNLDSMQKADLSKLVYKDLKEIVDRQYNIFREMTKCLKNKENTFKLLWQYMLIFPPSLELLDHITELYIIGNNITSLPPSIAKLSKLQKLDIGHNKLHSLPNEIGGLIELTDFDASLNQLTRLPNSIGRLAKLKKLDLSHNQLTELPSEIGQLKDLESLLVSHNKLAHLPPSIGHLLQLKFLYLASNNLTQFSSEFCVFTALMTLELSNNNLTELPSDISKLIHLRFLYLSGNKLVSLPSALGQLSYLENLNASNNRLSSLPGEVGQLKAFGHLDLGGNCLKALPPSDWQFSKSC